MVAINLSELVFDTSSKSFIDDHIVKCFDENGAVILRNFFDAEYLAEFIYKTEKYINTPSIAGSFGYYKKDYPKRFLDPFMIENFTKICVNKRLIKIIETYMNSKCTLAETFIKLDKATTYNYFPLHSDFWPGMKKTSIQKLDITKEVMAYKLAVGGALYLRDTVDGAFRYCLGSHKFMAPKGSRLDDYTKEEKAHITKHNWRIEGLQGDLVLFDDRGFHGPDQPSKKDRLVVLMDWFNDSVWGESLQSAPFRVYTSDLANLSPDQMRVLGVGAAHLMSREQYHIHGFARHRKKLYRIGNAILNLAGLTAHIKKTIKQKVRI